MPSTASPSWSCALLATSFWNTPRTACGREWAVRGGEDMRGKMHARAASQPRLQGARSRQPRPQGRPSPSLARLQVAALRHVAARALQVGLQQAHQGGHVAGALPEQRREQGREDGVVGLGHRAAQRPHLQQLLGGQGSAGAGSGACSGGSAGWRARAVARCTGTAALSTRCSARAQLTRQPPARPPAPAASARPPALGSRATRPSPAPSRTCAKIWKT